jgi:hypothetical protein
MKTAYNPKIVTAFFASQGIPEPEYEYQFAIERGRRWRFDLAWKFYRIPAKVMGYDSLEIVRTKVAIEVQGGIFIAGGHNRGAQIAKEHEKYTEAACLGWRILYCQPSELCTVEFAGQIKRALNL